MNDMRHFLGGVEPAFQCWDSKEAIINPKDDSRFLTKPQIQEVNLQLKDNLTELVLMLDDSTGQATNPLQHESYYNSNHTKATNKGCSS